MFDSSNVGELAALISQVQTEIKIILAPLIDTIWDLPFFKVPGMFADLRKRVTILLEI